MHEKRGKKKNPTCDVAQCKVSPRTPDSNLALCELRPRTTNNFAKMKLLAIVFTSFIVDTTSRKIDGSFAFLPAPLNSRAHRLDLPAISHHDQKKKKKKIYPDRDNSDCGVSPLQTGIPRQSSPIWESDFPSFQHAHCSPNERVMQRPL